MNKIEFLGDGNKVAQPAQVKVLVEHSTTAFDKYHYRYHYFESLEEAKAFRLFLFKHRASLIFNEAEFTINFKEDDSSTLCYEGGWIIETFKIHIVEVDPCKEYETDLTFEERVKRDEDWDVDPNNDVFAGTFLPIN